MGQDAYSRQVLEETPARATRFLQGIGAVSVIRTLLAEAGMRNEDLEEGRQLLLGCLAEPVLLSPELDTPEARSQREATAQLDQWDESNFARHGATLRRHFPDVHSYVFHDLKAQSGTSAVMGIATFLLRLDALEQGSDPTRAASRSDDLEALKLLEKRGLAKAEREQLRQLVNVALGPTQPLPALPRADDSAAARLARLTALRDWYNEWSSIARAVVRKRGYLIRLGLAVRKVAVDASEEEAELPGEFVPGAAP